MRIKHTFALLCAPFLTSCFPAITEDIEDDADPSGNVRIIITSISPIADTRAATALRDIASRLQVIVYDTSNNRIKQVSQTSEAESFGSARLTLADGEYRLVALAHSGDGNATTTNPEKVTFSGRITDTFVGCEDLLVDDGATASLSIDRCVARIRIVPTDDIPYGASRLRFYYTGGSSTLNAYTSFGSANSRQTEYRTPSEYYDLYTFPHSNTDLITLTITALDAYDNELTEFTLTDISVIPRYQTTLTGKVFTASASSDIEINVSNTEWNTIDYNF